MNKLDNVLNLLVDPESGNIYHVSSLAKTYFGVPSEQLRGMNLSRIFHQPIGDILASVDDGGYLKEVSLQMNESYPFSTAKAYASMMQIDKRSMLFLCIYGLQEVAQEALAA